MRNRISLRTATSLVIANMIGTGVFTSLGFQLLGITDVFAILTLWILGGVIAVLGAFAYSELGAAIPRSGGEYRYLSEIYHPFVGFLSGWVSSTIGFAAPIAAASWALGLYLNAVFPVLSPVWSGIFVIIGITILQSINQRIGSGFQRYATGIKVFLILLFIVSGLLADTTPSFSVMPTAISFNNIMSPAFAISLVYVSYAYSGWNASSYVAGEIEQAERNIPYSILGGTIFVAFLYVLLNLVFLKSTPIEEMKGVPEVAFVAAKYIFGGAGSKIVSLMISLLLISTISSMIIVGPRVISSMGEDYKIFSFLSKRNSQDIPFLAIIFQSSIAIIMLVSSSFESIITYISFTLSLFSTLTVFGVLVHRLRFPILLRPYKTWGYPFTPLLYILINSWFLYYVFTQKMTDSLIGIAIVAVGGFVYFLVQLIPVKASHD